jgi:hypothetical protein
MHGEVRNVHTILVGKHGRRDHLEDNIKFDLKEIGYEVMDLDISGSG